MVLNTRGRLLVEVTDEAAAANAIKHLLANAGGLADGDGNADPATAMRNASAHCACRGASRLAS